MRLVALEQIVPGTTLAQDVRTNPTAVPLLRSGAALNERYIKALAGAGVATVWVQDELSEGVEPQQPVTEETRRQTSAAVGGALAKARSTVASGGALPEEAVRELTDAAERIVKEVLDSPEAAYHLADMMGADQYLLQHVVDVTTLGILVGKRVLEADGWYDYARRRRRDGFEGRLTKLGIGLLLHDIGKLAVPPEVLNKPGALDADEWKVMREHPALGAQMLSEETSYLARAVVRSHHERFDGDGYPDGLSGERIHQHARIAAVADVYDAVTSARVYKPAAPPSVGVRIIHEGEGSAFDPTVVRAFDRVVVPYPPGYEVVLADGRTGVVADAPLDDPWRPTVRAHRDGGGVEEIVGAELAEAVPA